MSGMQMTGMDEGRGRGSAVGRFSAHDEAGATKTCPRCGAVLFSDMNRCYGCLYDFPEQVSEANPTALDEPWEKRYEPWGSLDGLWAEGEAAGGGAPPSAEMRDAALEESVGMPDVAPDVEEGAEGEPRAGVSESSGINRRLASLPPPLLLVRFRLAPRRLRVPPPRCPRPSSLRHFRHPSPPPPRLLRTLWCRRFPTPTRSPSRLSVGCLA